MPLFFRPQRALFLFEPLFCPFPAGLLIVGSLMVDMLEIALKLGDALLHSALMRKHHLQAALQRSIPGCGERHKLL